MSKAEQVMCVDMVGKEVDDYFGGCQCCGKNDGFLNIGSSHWFVCHEHKEKWCVGANLFSPWRSENKEDWQRNQEIIKYYHEVNEICAIKTAIDYSEKRDSNLKLLGFDVLQEHTFEAKGCSVFFQYILGKWEVTITLANGSEVAFNIDDPADVYGRTAADIEKAGDIRTNMPF